MESQSKNSDSVSNMDHVEIVHGDWLEVSHIIYSNTYILKKSY